jgi:hypothetical protein
MRQDAVRCCSSPDTAFCTAMTRRGARSKAIWAGSVSILGISFPVTPSCGVASRRITMETTNTKACRRLCVGFPNRLVLLTHAWHARSGHTKTVFPVSLYSFLYLCPFETKHTVVDFYITFTPRVAGELPTSNKTVQQLTTTNEKPHDWLTNLCDALLKIVEPFSRSSNHA